MSAREVTAVSRPRRVIRDVLYVVVPFGATGTVRTRETMRTSC